MEEKITLHEERVGIERRPVDRAASPADFAAFEERTIEARGRRRYADTGKLVGTAPARNARAFLKLQAEGTPDAVLHDAGLATPLLDTRSLLRSITHVIEEK